MIRKYISYMLFGASLSAGLSACEEEDLVSARGSFNIILQDAQAENSHTRALPEALTQLTDEVKKQFELSITAEDGQNSFEGNIGSYEAAPPALKPGKYTLRATFGENRPLALDEPYYTSSPVTATAEANRSIDVTIPCTVGNALASFTFSNETQSDEFLSDYTFETRVGETSVTCTETDGKNPYFSAGSTVDFYLTGTTIENKPVEYKFASIASAEAGMNYKYTLSIGMATEGDAILDIIVNTTVESVTINDTIPQEWLPKAQTAAEGFDENGILNCRETDDAPTTRLNFQALMPVEDIELTLDMTDPNFRTLSKTYTLASLSEEDRKALTDAGITLPALNTTTGGIDFTAMTGRLLCADDGSTLSNHISFRVKANKRWSETKEYTINTLRPEFSITVNENDSWSKEFAVRELNITAGNAEKVKAGTKFQYSADNGESWKDFSDNTAMKQKFGTHPDTKNYQVRALYRGVLTSNVEHATLETPMQLPNSGLDEWTDEVYYDDDYYCFYPWTSSDKGNCHWDTNNTWTTRHRWNASAFISRYNGFHAVSYVPGRAGGLAAELRNTANGRGNLSGNPKDYNKVAGKLFTGTFEAIKKGNDINGEDEFIIHKDAQFNVRPTALKFWHKYDVTHGSDYSDTWTAHIELLDANGNIIIQQEYEETGNGGSPTDWTEVTLTLPYADGEEYNKAAYIYIIFNSTNREGDGMLYWTQEYTFYINNGANTVTWEKAWYEMANNRYPMVGSKLTIDDISMVYDK